MKTTLSVILALAAVGNLATNYTLDGAPQVVANVASGLIVVATAVWLIVLGRKRA